MNANELGREELPLAFGVSLQADQAARLLLRPQNQTQAGRPTLPGSICHSFHQRWTIKPH